MVSTEAPASAEKGGASSRALGFYCLALMGSAQVAWPLVTDSRIATNTTVLALCFSVVFFAASRWKSERILWTFISVSFFCLLIEIIGVRTGFPFGTYAYGDDLKPTILGVPAIVPLAWFAMSLPAWEIARRLVPHRRWLRALVGGAALTAWDVFLDPQMVQEGFWFWPGGGFWQEVPLSNYLGWLATATVLMLGLSRLLDDARSNPWLVIVYVWMAGAETLGFLLPFAFDRPVIALVGGAIMLPPGVIALRSYRRPWLASE